MKLLKKITQNALPILLTLVVCFSCSNDDGSQTSSSTTAKLYTSNNADGNITIFDVTDPVNVTSKTLITLSTAADGIYYDSTFDAAIQASRPTAPEAKGNLEGYVNVSTAASGATVSVDISGSADMASPREVAVSGNLYVVADSADADNIEATHDGTLYVYTRSGESFTLRNTLTTSIKLWGITFIGTDLYAVADKTNKVVVYEDFLSNTTDARISASKTFIVEGITRTHGITYNADLDILVLTDIGDATSDSDGGFQVLTEASKKLSITPDGGTLALSEQVRIAGTSTLMGNPVDVALDARTGIVYVAEAANGGGRILGFNVIAGSDSNIAPIIDVSLKSASAVYLDVR